MMKVYRNRRRSNLHLWIMLVLIVLMMGILLTSFMMLLLQDTKNGVSALDPSNVNAGVSTDSGLSSNLTPDSSSDSVVAKPTSSKPAPEKWDGVTARKNGYAKMSYFDDAVFIGDSISEGLKLYGVLPAKNVIANQSVGLNQIYNDQKVYVTAKGKVTLDQALAGKNPKKIYVLLGSNGVPGFENDRQIFFYEGVVDHLKKEYPKAIIYLQSVTPVTAAKSKSDKNMNNTKIKALNKMIYKLAKEKEVYYLDVAAALRTKYGNLKQEYNGGDGIHFKKSGHEAMLDYYRRHTIDVD